MAKRVVVDRPALAAAVSARRADLGLSRTAVTAAGGPSAETLSKVEKGYRVDFGRVPVLSKLDTALQWPQGYAESLVHPDRRQGTADASLSFQGSAEMPVVMTFLTENGV